MKNEKEIKKRLKNFRILLKDALEEHMWNDVHQWGVWVTALEWILEDEK